MVGVNRVFTQAQGDLKSNVCVEVFYWKVVGIYMEFESCEEGI